VIYRVAAPTIVVCHQVRKLTSAYCASSGLRVPRGVKLFPCHSVLVSQMLLKSLFWRPRHPDRLLFDLGTLNAIRLTLPKRRFALLLLTKRASLHFFLAARALSTQFGYGRPAFLAAALADAFCAGERALGLPRDFGRARSQMGFFMSAPPRAQGLVDAGVGVVGRLGRGELLLHARHSGTE